MNKNFSFDRFYRFFGLSLLLCIGTSATGWAQGFFTLTDHAQQTHDTHFEILTDGYRVKTTYTHPLADVIYYFGDLHLNAAGEEIGWDSIERASTLFGPGYLWLPDNDLLEFDRGFSGSMDLQIRKLHLDGSILWSHPFVPVLSNESITDVQQNASGEIFMTGNEYNSLPAGGAANFLFYKFDINGGLVWTVRQPLLDSTSATLTVLPTHAGGCLYSNIHNFVDDNNASTIGKISSAGQILWSDTIDYYDVRMQENSQGEIFIYAIQPDSYNALLEKRTASGQLLWSKILQTSLFQNTFITPFGLTLAKNEDFVIMQGVYYNATQEWHSSVVRFDSDGNVLWNRHYAFLDSYWVGRPTGIAATPDNGFIIAGQTPESQPGLFVVKIDAHGNIYPGQISGQLALDQNVNCMIDSSEQALANWKVQLRSPNYTLYATTDSSGHYEMQDVPGDDYLLSAVLPASLWENCGEVPVAIPDTSSLAVTQDLPIQIVADCAFMTLDIATPALRRCFPNTYSVHYCNDGPLAADSAYIQVILDPLLHFNAASIPYTQYGDTLYFSLGTVPSLGCGDFTLTATVDCDSTLLGQTLCVEARIFPDSLCQPPPGWSGALLEGSGQCADDSVLFQLRNIGTAPLSTGLNFIILDDHVIMHNMPLPTLLPSDVHEVTVPADGSTWRMIADQEPNAPGLERPSIGVEGCGDGSPTWGFLLQFANRDGNPFTDRDCHEVVGSFDPNDKQAFPIGIHEQHLIEPNTPLDYQIRFQNTGTDTAFTVVVKDTLSAWLDPATMRPGAASHPYTWSLSGTGILIFTFSNILLPDSNVNEVASHGFIQFHVEQRQDVPLETLVENRAGIYFDFNAPVMTNTVFHAIGHDFLPSATREPGTALPLLQAWPNPASQVTRIWTEKPFEPGQRLVLRDALGRMVRDMAVQGQMMEIQRTGLPAGLYFVELHQANRVIAVGKVVWE